MHPIVKWLQDQLAAELRQSERLIDEPCSPLTNYVMGHASAYAKALKFYYSLHPDNSRTETK